MTRHIPLSEAVRLLARLPKLPVLAEGELIETFEPQADDEKADQEARRGAAVGRLRDALGAGVARAWGRPTPHLGAPATGPMEVLPATLFHAPDAEIIPPFGIVRRRPPAFHGGPIAPLWRDVMVDADALGTLIPKPGSDDALAWWMRHAEETTKRIGKPPKRDDAKLCVDAVGCTLTEAREAYHHLPAHLRNHDRRKRNTQV